MSTQVINTDDQGFDSTVLQAREPVLVDFWAPGCPPCVIIAPILEDLAAAYKGRLRVVKINTNDSPDVTSRYGIMGVPSLLFFKDGREAHRLIGARPRTRLAEAIEHVLAMTGVAAS